MRTATTLFVTLSLLALIVACGGEGPITIIFTGDDHGYVTPAG